VPGARRRTGICAVGAAPDSLCALRLTACARAGSLLARVYQILKTKVALEDELDKLKRGSVGPATTPSRPVTRSGAAAAVGPPVAAPTKPVEMADARKIK